MSDASHLFEIYMESVGKPLMTQDQHGNKRWTLNGQLHREDGPAWIWPDGSKAWYQWGKLHRIDGAAIEYANGDKIWHVNGLLHRTDGAAVEFADGSKEWYINSIEYDDVAAWAKAALMYEHKPVTQQSIDDKIAQVMQQDLFD